MIRTALTIALSLSLLTPNALAAVAPTTNDKIEASIAALDRGDKTTARRLAEEAAESGDPLALNNLVIFLENGIGGRKDSARATALLERAAAAGLPVAKLNLGLRLHFSETPADQARGFGLLREAFNDEKVQPLTLWPLGRAMLLGRGTPQDLVRGLETLELSLKVDNQRADAFYLVGRAYQNGWGGVKPDLGKAYSHFSRAAQLGDERAERYVGMALLRGDGVTRDEAAALAAFRSAAEHGSVDAMIDVAVMLATGEGVQADPPQARTWYRRAVDKGSAHALRGLGMMLLLGEGGPVDVAAGHAYVELAAAGGDENAKRILEGAIGPMPHADRASIEAAKAAWLKDHPPPRGGN